jgi:hypothetical protein
MRARAASGSADVLDTPAAKTDLRRQGAHDVDARMFDELTQLLKSEISLAARHEARDWHAGRRDKGPRRVDKPPFLAERFQGTAARTGRIADPSRILHSLLTACSLAMRGGDEPARTATPVSDRAKSIMLPLAI